MLDLAKTCSEYWNVALRSSILRWGGNHLLVTSTKQDKVRLRNPVDIDKYVDGHEKSDMQ
jgi:hypothetical protein